MPPLFADDQQFSVLQEVGVLVDTPSGHNSQRFYLLLFTVDIDTLWHRRRSEAWGSKSVPDTTKAAFRSIVARLISRTAATTVAPRRRQLLWPVTSPYPSV